MSFFKMFDRDNHDQKTSQSPAQAQLDAKVTGRVQGVGFRWWTREQATPLGLTGYAKNLDDGSVEILAQGSKENCQKLLEILRSGDTAGEIQQVEATIGEPRGSYKDFGTY